MAKIVLQKIPDARAYITLSEAITAGGVAGGTIHIVEPVTLDQNATVSGCTIKVTEPGYINLGNFNLTFDSTSRFDCPYNYQAFYYTGSGVVTFASESVPYVAVKWLPDFSKAIAAGSTILLSSSVTLTANYSGGAGKHLTILNGGSIISNTYSFTWTGILDADNYQVFSGFGAGNLILSNISIGSMSRQVDVLGKLTNTIYIDGYSISPGVHGRKASGTEATPTNTKLYDDIVLMTSTGYDGTSWTNTSGYAGLYATENWSGTANGTAFVVGLTANGSAAALPYAPVRFVIYGDGRVIINGNTPPTASAALEIKGTNGALLLPRMDVAQRNALAPTDGMVIYLTGYGLHARTLGSWQNIITGGGPDIYSVATGFVGIGGAAGTSCKLDINGTDGALRISRLTVAQRDALTASDGMIMHLTGYGFHGRNNGAWANFVMGSGPDIWAVGTGFVGIGGTSVTSAKLAINGTDGALLLPRLTTDQRDALTASGGMMIYNTSIPAIQARVGIVWGSLVFDPSGLITIASNKLGIGGTPVTSAKVDIQGTDGALLLPRLTTAQRDALTNPTNGMVIYNATLNKFQGYENSAWANLI